jgi:hypothetical protein
LRGIGATHGLRTGPALDLCAALIGLDLQQNSDMMQGCRHTEKASSSPGVVWFGLVLQHRWVPAH